MGRFGFKPEAIVLHIAEGSLIGAYSWFNTPTSKVSSHYMVGKNGEVWQFVADENTAWHAGGAMNPTWNLLKPNVNPNFYTIGIENEGFTGNTFTDSMYTSLAQLIALLCQKFDIPLDRDHIIGHYQINSVSRANCPGSGLDFSKLISLSLNYYEDPIMIKELQQQIQNLQSQISDLQSQKTSMQDQINSLITENNNLTANVRELESSSSDDVQVLRQKNSQLTKEVLRLQKSETELTKKLYDLQNKNNSSLSGTSSGNLINGIINFFKKIINE